MPQALRYTKDWPPLEVFRDYPNWTFALDEEALEGQDETTLRPEREQRFITGDTAATSGDALFADGRSYLAIITLLKKAPISVDVFETAGPWRVRHESRTDRWFPHIETWIPESERMRHVAMSDSRIFPLRVVTRLPYERGGAPYTLEIQLNGSAKDVK